MNKLLQPKAFKAGRMFSASTLQKKQILFLAVIYLILSHQFLAAEPYYQSTNVDQTSSVVAENESTNQNQPISVEGIVSDDEGPLIGVNILIKGTSHGTITDLPSKSVIVP